MGSKHKETIICLTYNHCIDHMVGTDSLFILGPTDIVSFRWEGSQECHAKLDDHIFWACAYSCIFRQLFHNQCVYGCYKKILGSDLKQLCLLVWDITQIMVKPCMWKSKRQNNKNKGSINFQQECRNLQPIEMWANYYLLVDWLQSHVACRESLHPASHRLHRQQIRQNHFVRVFQTRPVFLRMLLV